MSRQRKILLFSLIIIILIISSIFLVELFSWQKNKQKNIAVTPKQDIRQPVVAGQYYPNNQDDLNGLIDEFLAQVKIKKYEGAPQILIIPHAGYTYSGQVAAYGFKALENTHFQRVIIIGKSHHQIFSGVAADWQETYQLPNGQMPVDQEFIDLLIKTTPLVIKDKEIHLQEQTLEVELPLLIKTLGQDIKIVPLLFGDNQQKTIKTLAQALLKLIDKNTLVVISSDLSHYPSFDNAALIDQKTIQAILTGNINIFQNKVRELENLKVPQVVTLACAEPAISTALILAQNLNLKPHLLKYANTSESEPGLKNKVVGYAAIIFNNLNLKNMNEDIFQRELNQKERVTALKIARQTLEAFFRKEVYKPDISGQPIFQTKRGAFVTLKKQGQLRGCIGYFEPKESLSEVIQAMALSAAFQDTRFYPLNQDELKDIEIEISVLSPRQKITNPDIIEVGKHGVYIQQGSQSGVFLPQVATEQGWDKETFLNHLCEDKAGLNKDAWKNGSADLYIFTAQVFSEK